MDESLSVKLLYTALADEWLAYYQYWTCRNLSRGNLKFDADPEFEQHASDELEHANKIVLRLKELGGSPIPDPKNWTDFSNPWTPILTHEVVEQLKITIQAEKDAIVFYKGAIEQLQGVDETTHKLFRSNLSDEEEHLYDLEEVIAEAVPDYFEKKDLGEKSSIDGSDKELEEMKIAARKRARILDKRQAIRYARISRQEGFPEIGEIFEKRAKSLL